MQLCNSLGLSAAQLADIRCLRFRRRSCCCTQGCSTSGLPESSAVAPRGAPLRTRQSPRHRRFGLVQSYALNASQGDVYGGGYLQDQRVLIRSWGLRDLLKYALAHFVFLVSKAASVIVHLSTLFLLDVQKGFEKQEAEAQMVQQREADEALARSKAEAAESDRRNRAMALMLEAKDAAFHHMLKCMDDTSFNFEEKWALIMRQTGKPEFSRHVRTLFAAAGKSSKEVRARALDGSQLWKSSTTQEVIAQEAALKRIVFQQMLLQGGQA